MQTLVRIFSALVISLLILSVNTSHAAQNKTSDANLFRIELQTESPQPVVGNNTITLTVYDARSNAPVDDAIIEAVPWMTMHGHGSSKKTSVKQLGSGRYRVENVYLSMEGDWDLIVTVKTKAGKDTVTLTISGVKNK